MTMMSTGVSKVFRSEISRSKACSLLSKTRNPSVFPTSLTIHLTVSTRILHLSPRISDITKSQHLNPLTFSKSPSFLYPLWWWCCWLRCGAGEDRGKIRCQEKYGEKHFKERKEELKDSEKQDRVNVARKLSRKTRASYFQETNPTWIKKSSARLDFHWEDDRRVCQECILEETT